MVSFSLDVPTSAGKAVRYQAYISRKEADQNSEVGEAGKAGKAGILVCDCGSYAEKGRLDISPALLTRTAG